MIDEDAAPEFTSVEISATALFPSSAGVAWNGSNYGVAWSDTRNGREEIYFDLIAPDGSRVNAEPLTVQSDAGGQRRGCVLVWNGSEFGLVWGLAAVFYARISEGGQLLDGPLAIPTTGDLSSPRDLVWTGFDWAVIWDSLSATNYSRFNINGEEVQPAAELGGLRGPGALALRGGRIGFVWHSAEPPYGIYFAEATIDGEVLVPGRATIQTNPPPGNPSIAATSTGYIIAWVEIRHAGFSP